MIPKIAHFYWGQETLPYMRYLTLKSFCRYNPDWEVRLYIPVKRSEFVTWPTHEHKYQISAGDYFERVKDLPLSIYQMGFDHIGPPERILPEVHKSDFLRWHLLANVGGLWSDMDILYIKPMSLNLDRETYICTNPAYGHSIGFLLAGAHNPVYRTACKAASQIYDPLNYQGAGSIVMNKINNEILRLDPLVYNIPMDIVYPFDALNIARIFSPYIYGAKKYLTDQTIGIHWFAGHGLAGEFQNGKIQNCLLLDTLKKEGYDAEFHNSIGCCE